MPIQTPIVRNIANRSRSTTVDRPDLKYLEEGAWTGYTASPLLSLCYGKADNSKIIILKAQGVPQYNNVAHPKHPEEEETSPNRNHIITGKQQQTN